MSWALLWWYLPEASSFDSIQNSQPAVMMSMQLPHNLMPWTEVLSVKVPHQVLGQDPNPCTRSWLHDEPGHPCWDHWIECVISDRVHNQNVIFTWRKVLQQTVELGCLLSFQSFLFHSSMASMHSIPVVPILRGSFAVKDPGGGTILVSTVLGFHDDLMHYDRDGSSIIGHLDGWGWKDRQMI